MEIRFAPLSLSGIDGLESELLCLPIFEDERPLRGAAGLVDWRLCGRLSTFLVDGLLTGRSGEALLMPPPEGRLRLARLLLLGAGPRAVLDELGHRVLMEQLVARALSLRIRTLALALPHDTGLAVDVERAADPLLEACAAAGDRLDELVIVGSDETRRAMLPRLEHARRRALLED